MVKQACTDTAFSMTFNKTGLNKTNVTELHGHGLRLTSSIWV